MNLEQLTEWFKWMTIINIVFLLFSTLAVIALKSVMMNLHTKMFGITESQISVAVYAYLGLFKALVIVFNIVPYIALLILNK